ncbi:MAG: Fur family transcriptional regulator [Peptococcaceae bacterium]|nr:Fur family transcriptional regulator [Peptococcaceae bacterium]
MDVTQETLYLLKEKGIRVTPQRQAILEYLKHVDTHPNAEEIYAHIRTKFAGISLGTIYNSLNMLCDKGLIQELAYGDTFSRFDGNPMPHDHIVCDVCRKVVDYHGPLLDNLLDLAQQESGFAIKGYRLELHGVCPACQN